VPNYRPDGDVFYDLFRRGNYDAPENTESVWVAKSTDYETFLDYSYRSGGWLVRSYAPRWNIQAYPAPELWRMRWKPEFQEAGASGNPWRGNVDWEKYTNTHYYRGGDHSFTPTYYLAYKIWGNDAESVVWNDMRNNELNNSRIYLCIDRDHSLYGQPVTEDMIVLMVNGKDIDMKLFPTSAKVFYTEDLWGFEPTAFYTGSDVIYGRDRYLVRSAETYLLRAEAYLRNGQIDKATEDINALRERAECAKLFTEGEVDIYTILDERARELSYEEQRWATLLRIGGEVMKNQLYNNAKYVADRPVFTGTIDWELLPIPRKTVININTGAEIQQNPGWESGK
jgi:hypothetical protein